MIVKSSDVIESLLVALLAVNRWSVERVYEIRQPLREAGLLDLELLSELNPDEVARRLMQAGHTRGDYMNTLMASRVLSMAEVLRGGELERVTQLVRTRDKAAAMTTLQRIKGVGPTVMHSFWTLLD